jgi:hypothetical protein
MLRTLLTLHGCEIQVAYDEPSAIEAANVSSAVIV